MTRKGLMLVGALSLLTLGSTLRAQTVGDSDYPDTPTTATCDYDDKDALAEMDFQTVHQLGEQFFNAGDPQCKYEMVSNWILASTQYQQLSAADLLIASRAISQATKYGPEARKTLADWLEKTYFDDAKFQAVGISAWKDFSRYLLHDLGAARQNKWADKIASVFAGSADAIKALSAQDIADLVYTDQRLFGNRSGNYLKTWLSGNKALANWSSSAISKGLAALSKTGADSAAACGVYGNLVGDQYLADGTTDKLSADQWKKIAKAGGAGMSAAYQSKLRDKLQAAFGTSDAIAKMTQTQADEVSAALKAVGLATAGDVEANWLLNTSAGQALAGKNLVNEVKKTLGNGVSPNLANQLVQLLQAQLP